MSFDAFVNFELYRSDDGHEQVMHSTVPSTKTFEGK